MDLKVKTNMMRRETCSGISMVELLVILSIIGVLASATLIAVDVIRKKSVTKTQVSLLETVRAGAALCLFNGEELTSPAIVHEDLCAGSENRYPPLSGGWEYDSVTSDTGLKTFSISITRDTETITCTQEACTGP